jgi:thiol-disulfide isomerase/thioredoxin
MQKNALIILVSIALIICASVTYLLFSRSASVSEKSSTNKMQSAKKASASPAAETPPTNNSASEEGVYTEYTEQHFEDKKATTRLLFFHAKWCPQCRKLDDDIKKATLPDGVTILKVDYDSSQDLRQKYGVTLQTTVVKVDSEGNKTASIVAYDNPSFQAIKDELL